MAVKLNDLERRVLVFLRDHGDYQFNYFSPDLLAAAYPDAKSINEFRLAEVMGTLKGLRRRKLVDQEGRGKWAQYGSNDKGNNALENARG